MRALVNPPFCGDKIFYWEKIGVYAFYIYYLYGVGERLEAAVSRVLQLRAVGVKS
jgi:hypothetical protein